MADSERMGSRKGDNCNNGAAQSSAESELFEVEKILSKSKSAGKLLYKVRWKGYGPEDDTWEPVRNLGSCKDIIEEFENKLREAARKRAEERRLQKLMMESRAGKPESQDSNSPYPANFKNTFWKELEAGRVNVFDNDMYSKVKSKRAATQGKSNSDTSSNEDNMKSSSEKGKSTSSSHKKKTHKTHSSSKPKNTSTPKTTIAIISETETDENSQPQDVNFCESGDETLDKTAPLSLVIRRVSDTSPDTRAPARNTHSESPNYTVLPKSNPERSSSSRKKSKKHHKHHKRKLSKEKESRNSKRREPSCDTAVFTPGNSKKRKISEDTAVSTVDSPVNRSEKGDDIWNMLLHDDTDKLNHPESHQMTESIKDISPNSPVTSCEPENTSKSTEISTDSVLTVTHAQNNEFAIPKSSDLNKSNTCDREKLADLPLNVSRISNTSVHGQSVKEEQVVCPGSSTDCFPLTPQEPDASLFSSFTDSMASEMQSLCRQNSDTFDSGVYSPISEKSGRSLGLELTGEGDRVPILPLLGDKNKGSDKADCGGDLEIELDDLDWDLFDKEVTFTPTTLSNKEFAGAVWSGDYELVRRALLGDGKYNMDTRDNEGRTLLMHTVKHGHDDISHLLVENGADVNGKTSTGWTPLMIACQHAEIQTVSLLLEMGAHVNMTSAEGMTPLIVISKRGHTQILWLLLECGANFNAVTATGHTASDITRLLYYTDMQNILHSHIQRVMAEYNKQVSVTLNQTARVLSSMFPAQVYNVCEGPTFTYSFHHTLSPPNSGLGYLLFIGQSMFSSEEVKCRLYGPCAVKAVTLNGHPLASLTDCGNFVLAFSPLINGRNTITIHALSAQEAKAKLIMCAYKAQLCNS